MREISSSEIKEGKKKLRYNQNLKVFILNSEREQNKTKH